LNERSVQVPRKASNLSAAREQPPSIELVLAALERAERHRARQTPDVPGFAVLEHLGVRRRSAAARGVRAQLEVLLAEGSLRRSRRHGIQTWVLTAAGRRRLRRARDAGAVPPLPESPQHLAWREARTLAAQEIGRFERSFGECLAEGRRLLDAEPPPASDEWFAIGERLQRGAWRLGSAAHCLREWTEPDDSRADIDQLQGAADAHLDPAERGRRRARRVARRNIRLWRDASRG
jgi:hypothetical protein